MQAQYTKLIICCDGLQCKQIEQLYNDIKNNSIHLFMLKKIYNKLTLLTKESVPVQTPSFEAIDTVNRNPIVTRYQIINHLVKKFGYTSYLEIGVRNPDECFNFIECAKKHGVDPGVEGDYAVDFNMTSDEFFAQNTNKYDIIFIDGLHIDEQVSRDIRNAIHSITENGTVLLHDCNPPTLHHAREDYYDFTTPAKDYWNGTVWKSIVEFRASELAQSYECNVVNTDWGVGIIRKTNNGHRIVNNNPFYSFRKFELNRSYYIGLISIEEFYLKYR
jgi:hypothetical protein